MASGKDILLGRIRSGEGLSFGQQLKLSLMLSYPAILAQLSSVMMQYIDASMVGHLGPAAGASIGLVSTCLWLFGGFGMAATSGFSVQVAHLVGANDFSGARSVLRQALVCVLAFSLFLAVVGMGISPFLPHWLGGGDDITGDATSYFFIITLFMPAMIMDWTCAAILQASGNMKVPSILSIGMCLMDVAFNYLFIYKMGMGVVGAAIGTGLAMLITAALMMYFLLVRSKMLALKGRPGSFKPKEDTIRTAFKIGAPMGLQHMMMGGAYIVSTVIVAPLGTISIAAHSLAITVESLCYMPGYGIAEAATTLVGQGIGAGQKLLTRSFARMSVGLGIAVMTVMGLLMWIFAPELMSIMSPVEEVIALGTEVLRIEAWAEPMFAAAIVCNGVFIGAGDTIIPALMSLGSMWAVRLTLAATLAPKYGLKGVWTAMAIELTFRGSIFLARLFKGHWAEKLRRLRLSERRAKLA